MILFPHDATEFTTFGDGVLSDAVSCIVTEERNGSYELEMRYPIKGKLYDSILPRSIIYAEAHPGDFQPFRVYEISKPIFGTVTYYARHISYDLSGIPVSPFSASNVAQALSRLSSYALATNPFTFWTDKSTTGDLTVTAPSSTRSILGGQEGSILDIYGGEYEYDGYTVRLYGERGSDNGVSIRYGKNLVDLNQEENVAECYTGIIGYYLSDDGNVTGAVQSLGTFDYTRILTLDLSSDFDSIPTQAQVDAAALAYANANRISIPRVSLSLSYAQLEDEVVNLCDTVHVTFETLGIEVSAKVVKTEFNPLSRRYESIEIGDARQTVADTIAQTAATTKVLAGKSSEGVTATELATAISRATASITGVSGGNVVIHQDSNGKPYEVLIMDTDDIDTATKVWRWNEEGLGYSSTGYDGEYGLAMTADGEIVADFITTGTLDASTIDVVHLSASSIDSGTLSANRISQTYTDDVLSQAFTAAGGLVTAEVTARTSAVAAANERITNLNGRVDAVDAAHNATEAALSSNITQQAGEIAAKVSKTGGASSSFGWSLTDSQWTLTANNQTVLKATASGVEVTGKVTATSGSVGGFEIGQNTITSKGGTFYVGMGNSTSGAQAFWAGAERADQAPFRVDHLGNMFATSGTFTGTVYAGSIASGDTPGYISSGMCDINIRNALANAFTAADIFAGNAYATYMRVTGSISTPAMSFNGYSVRWGTVSEGRNVLVRN